MGNSESSPQAVPQVEDAQAQEELQVDQQVSPTKQRKTISSLLSAGRKNEYIKLEWRDVCYSTFTKDPVKSGVCKTVYNEKYILQSLNGYAESGQMLAIMGPTGCGKTSLMNVLAARVPDGGSSMQQLTGSVYVNGEKRDEAKFRKISAYVLQDDYMYTHLTVAETLMLSAHFYLPQSMTQEQKDEVVDTIIMELGLNKARDTKIGNDKVRGVSGGERKRANIAVQLISDPAVLFLDEPTSGLDSFQALSVMQCMKELAESGRLVVSIIHQPRSSIYAMFDKLLLLSEGKTMFFGKATEAVEYFAKLDFVCKESFNPADYFLDLFSPDNRSKMQEDESTARIKKLADAWRVEETAKGLGGSKTLEDGSSGVDNSKVVSSSNIELIGNRTNFAKVTHNLKLLAWRSWSEQSRDVVTFIIKCFITSFFAFVIGGVYSNIGNRQASIQNRKGLLFFAAINNAFNGVIGVLNTFPKEKTIVNRERGNRAYDTTSYFFAKFFCEIPLNIFPSFVYCCILYWLAGLNPDRFGQFFSIAALETLVAVSLGLGVSAIMPTIEAANAVGPICIIIGLLFGGFYIDVGSLPIVANWIPYVSFIRWAFEAFCINEFKDLKFDCYGAPPGACIKTGEQVLASLSFDGATTGDAVMGLGLCGLGFLAFAYLVLYNSRAVYTPVGHKGGKVDSLRSAASAAAANASAVQAATAAGAAVDNGAATNVGMELVATSDPDAAGK